MISASNFNLRNIPKWIRNIQYEFVQLPAQQFEERLIKTKLARLRIHLNSFKHFSIEWKSDRVFTTMHATKRNGSDGASTLYV